MNGFVSGKTLKNAVELPRHACRSINHCNLPATILGGLTFQQHPVRLHIDGIDSLHDSFFNKLFSIDSATERAGHFMAYMKSAFLLDYPDEIGLQGSQQRFNRQKASYLKVLQGWLFTASCQEAAVLKGWVESRFGLLTLYHRESLFNDKDDFFIRYQHDRSMGLYNTNALETQLDLLYSYCQYELEKQCDQSHITLYRGTNTLKDYQVLHKKEHQAIVLLNNLSSFTSDKDRADEFGDTLIKVEVPVSKIVYYQGLLPQVLKGENEYLVIGGLYKVSIL